MSNAQMDFPALAESITIEWIERVAPAPASMKNVLKQYQNLVLYVGQVDDPVADRIMNRLYDSLLTAADREAHVAVRIAAQARRLERKRESKRTWVERCNRAIQAYNEGIRV